MKEHVGWFVLHLLLVLGLLLFMLNSMFRIGGYLFWLEIVVLLGLVVLGIMGVAHHMEHGARGVLFFFYGVSFLNVIVITALTRKLSIGSFVLSFIGFIFTFNYRDKKGKSEERLGEHAFDGEELKHEAEKSEPIIDVTLLPEKKATKKKRGRKKQKKGKK